MSSDVKKTIDFEAQLADMDKEGQEKGSTDADTGKQPSETSRNGAPAEEASNGAEPEAAAAELAAKDWSQAEAEQKRDPQNHAEAGPRTSKGDSEDA
jgi:hypothetical protein